MPSNRAGGHFSPHLDGPWVPHEDESSVFTVVIYLNSDFQGGETQFLGEVTKGTVRTCTEWHGCPSVTYIHLKYPIFTFDLLPVSILTTLNENWGGKVCVKKFACLSQWER